MTSQQKQTVTPVTHDGIDFILVRGGVKNINLRITHDGTVRVSAPKRMSLDTVLDFIASKKAWILDHKDKIRPREGCFLCLGEQIPVSSIKDKNEFLKEKAERVLAGRFNSICKDLGIIEAPRLIIKPLKGKYGYYTKSTHEICLNARLIMVPVQLIDYVIVHELLHTKYFNHGREFHEAIRSIIPREKELRNLLGKYILW